MFHFEDLQYSSCCCNTESLCTTEHCCRACSDAAAITSTVSSEGPRTKPYAQRLYPQHEPNRDSIAAQSDLQGRTRTRANSLVGATELRGEFPQQPESHTHRPGGGELSARGRQHSDSSSASCGLLKDRMVISIPQSAPSTVMCTQPLPDCAPILGPAHLREIGTTLVTDEQWLCVVPTQPCSEEGSCDTFASVHHSNFVQQPV